MKKKIQLSLIFLFISGISYSQQKREKGENVYGWVSVGTCLSFSDDFYSLPGLRASLDVSLYQKYFISFAWSGHNALEFNFSEEEKPDRVLHLDNKSVLLGLGKYKFGYLAFIGYTGISWGNGTLRDGYHLENALCLFCSGSTTKKVYDRTSFHYVGIPVHFKVLWTAPYCGLSIDLYYNFHRHADYGIILSGNFGKIRKPEKR